MVVSVQAFADALFAPLPVSREMKDRRDKLLDQVLNLPSDPAEVFLAEFASLHLPAFLHLLRSNWAFLHLRSDVILLATHLSYFTAFSKWMRDSGYQAGLEFAKEIVRWVNERSSSEVMTGGWSVPLSKANVICIHSVARVCALVVSILQHVPREPGLRSSLDLVTSMTHPELGRRLLVMASQEILRSQAVVEVVRDPRLSLAVLQSILAQKWPDRSAQSLDFLSQKSIWTSCEARRAEVESSCSDGEMMACGKCLLVQYCCRDHQRADWKRHKLQCFRVTWDVRDTSEVD